ncbi:MAG TPA: ribosome biogenesis GTPase YlqF [Bacilli bacterium]|nr:ribosome biogenesis GTPase YlqF [Bacilli bacterium]
MAKDMYQKREERKNKKHKIDTKVNINWYPGHMAKTKREIKEKLCLIDVVYELIDARIPFSSKINDIEDVIKNKPRILIMTKKDLCDLKETNKWIKYYQKKGYEVLLLDLTNNKDYKELITLTNEVTKSIQDKRELLNLNKKEIKALVIGIPNVGKSTLINSLAAKKVAKTGNTPGITKQLNWLKTKSNILLLDTPGILWPKFDNETIALNLASMTAIKNDILPIDKVAIYILEMLNKYYPNLLLSRYKIAKLDEDILVSYETIGRNLQVIKKGNEVDCDKLSQIIVNDMKNELIKNITFDRYEEHENR